LSGNYDKLSKAWHLTTQRPQWPWPWQIDFSYL